MSAETILAISMAGFTGLALSFAAIKTSGQSSFLYANARMTARSSFIIDREKIETLLYAENLGDLINSLKDSEYSPFLESIDKKNIRQFNAALEKSFVSSLLETQKLSPKKFKKVFDIYIKIFEAKIIKTFFRSRFSDVPLDKDLLEPMGAINPTLLTHLYDTKTVADLKVVLRDTEYSSLFDREFKSIEEFDLDIEQKIIKDVDIIIGKARFFDIRSVKEVLNLRRSVKEILLLLKLRIRNVSNLPEGIIHLKGINMKSVLKALDLSEFIELFRSTEFYGHLKKALDDYNRYNNYFSFEKELWAYYYSFVVSRDLAHNIGPYPIISYITKKEIEKMNILIVAKGIASGLSKDEIRRMII